ncbi:MAG: endo-1,4-beta-xylanase [Erysipelotrichia bacterium]|nr:endo-1,4-beta-xylanase [Erysipelotrichia bacterium]
MNNKKRFFFVFTSFLLTAALVACGGPKPLSSSQPPRPLEIGDTVKEWRDRSDFDVLPIDVEESATNGSGTGEIVNDFGRDDNCSLYFEVTQGTSQECYLGSDVITTPYFLEEDAKNGDIISLYVYVAANSNVASLQLVVYPSSMNNPIRGNLINISEENQDTWVRAMVSFDTLETFGALRLFYKGVVKSQPVTFYVDDIDITFGAETVITQYEYKGESLTESFKGYLNIGTCLSNLTLNNTKIRQITLDNFDSLVAENEAQPEQVLDQAGCQALYNAGNDSGVAIKITPFEKLYNFAEANHLPVRHHTFVWYSQTPAWFFTTNYTANGPKASRDLMIRRMDSFIKESLDTVNYRWPGLVYAIDVANEAISQSNVGIRDQNNNWYSTVGEDFVYQAFKSANSYREQWQKLYYNDFAYDYQPVKCSFTVDTLLKEAIEEGYVDGVGIQGHLDSGANMDNVIANAEIIFNKGLECQITELDITVNGTSVANYESQKAAYKNLTKKVLQANAAGTTDVDAIILWGVTDNTSWKRNQNPLLFDSNYAKKPAYYGMLEALAEVHPVEEVEQ